MARPRKRRFCRAHEADPVFKPRSVPMTELDVLELPLSALEALRLCDLEGLGQQEAGVRMGISRGTVQRLLKQGRSTVTEALVTNRALIIRKGTEDAPLHTHRDG